SIPSPSRSPRAARSRKPSKRQPTLSNSHRASHCPLIFKVESICIVRDSRIASASSHPDRRFPRLLHIADETSCYKSIVESLSRRPQDDASEFVTSAAGALSDAIRPEGAHSMFSVKRIAVVGALVVLAVP